MAAGSSVRGVIPFRVRPMLAALVAAPFDKPGWVYEEKYDRDKILAYKEGSRVRLLSSPRRVAQDVLLPMP
jgi:bifunctional non-homologous end joining protein LigD